MNNPQESKAKAIAKTPVHNMMAMLVQRALSLLPRRAQALVSTQFDDQDSLIPKSENLPAAVIAARKEYSRYFLGVEKWWRDRAKDGIITYRIPDHVALQPDLSDSEKFFLADVAYLQKGEGGCYKTNFKFAIELGLPEKVVKNMISRLKAAGFLVAERKDGRRLLRVTINEGELVNKNGKAAAIDGRAGSPESDHEVTGKLPPRHRKITERSSESDGKNVNKRSPMPENIGQEGAQPDRHPSEDKRKTATTTEGAAPPVTPASSSSPSAIKGDCRPPEPPAQASDADPWLENFKELYRLLKSSRFGADGWNQNDEQAATAFHREHPQWNPLSAMTVIVLAWENIGMTVDNDNGTTYGFGACQNSGSLPHCVKHWQRIVSDVNGAGFPTTRKNQLKGRIEVSIQTQLQGSGLNGDGLEDKLVGIHEEMERIVGHDDMRARGPAKKENGPVKVAITCGECGHERQVQDDVISFTCAKCKASVPGPLSRKQPTSA